MDILTENKLRDLSEVEIMSYGNRLHNEQRRIQVGIQQCQAELNRRVAVHDEKQAAHETPTANPNGK